MIFEHFHATGACEAVQCLSDVFSIRLQNDDVQDFYVRWAQALQSATELPTEMILEEIVSQKLQASDCLGFVRPRNCSNFGTAKLSKIEGHGKKTH